MVRSYVPERGDVVAINFDPQEGREQSGRRPAIVLSPATYNGKVGLAIFCPITRQKKGHFSLNATGSTGTGVGLGILCRLFGT